MNILSDLAENAESESVRLGATRDLLDRAGFRPVDRHEIVKHKSIEELNAQLVSLVGENGAELLVGAFRSRRSISGPELAGWVINKYKTINPPPDVVGAVKIIS